MKHVILTLCFFVTAFLGISQTAVVIKSPGEIPLNSKKTKIFLAGSIDMGKAEDWQAKATQNLINENVIIFNPRRDDWNKEWKPLASDSNFKKQVEWELSALESSDIIIMYFEPSSQSPITLLELGLYVKSKKLLVVCPDGFWRKGNVDITCKRYNVKMYNTLDDLLAVAKKKIKKKAGK